MPVNVAATSASARSAGASSMTGLDLPDSSVGGVLAFHIRSQEVIC